jgi:hypothetical protein
MTSLHVALLIVADMVRQPNTIYFLMPNCSVVQGTAHAPAYLSSRGSLEIYAAECFEA